MSKKIQISIPTPCHENWENMTPTEKGKFCASCQKQVIDFSLMSDREIATFFKNPSTGSTCGRFTNDQLNRNIEIPKKRIPWVKYFFQFTLPAFLISMKVSAQKQKGTVNDVVTICSNPILGNVIPRINQKPIVEDSIKGKVVDADGRPISFATVIIKGTNIGTQANTSGEFTLHVKQDIKKTILVASAVGYLSQELIVSGNVNLIEQPIILKLGAQPLGEVVVVGGFVSCKRVKAKKKDSTSTVLKIQEVKKLEDNTAKAFKVYPNPIQSGSSLNIKWKQSETGYFIFQLIDQSGQAIFNKEMWVDDNAALLDVQLPQVVTGNYFIRMISKQTGKSFSQKIIIQ